MTISREGACCSCVARSSASFSLSVASGDSSRDSSSRIRSVRTDPLNSTCGENTQSASSAGKLFLSAVHTGRGSVGAKRLTHSLTHSHTHKHTHTHTPLHRLQKRSVGQTDVTARRTCARSSAGCSPRRTRFSAAATREAGAPSSNLQPECSRH